MELDIRVDIGEVEDLLNRLGDGLRDEAAYVLDASIQEIIMPRLYGRSIAVWGVRTGQYSNSWYSEIRPPNRVEIGNTVPYSAPLETGWRARNGKWIPSVGVLIPTVLESMEDVKQAMVNWLRSKIRR